MKHERKQVFSSAIRHGLFVYIIWMLHYLYLHPLVHFCVFLKIQEIISYLLLSKTALLLKDNVGQVICPDSPN